MFLYFPNLLYDGINKTNDNAIMISGFKIFAGMCRNDSTTTRATNISGNIFPTIFKSTLPERKNFNALVNVLKELANLFVPKATDGKPTN